MSTRDEDPVSPASVAAHVLVLLILLVGGCLIEWIKHRWEPPLFTNALLSLGEGTMFIYMIGAVGKAFWWMVEQWKLGKPIAQSGELLRQFMPTKMDLTEAFKPTPLIRNILTFILALLILFLLFEVIPSPGIDERNARLNAKLGREEHVLMQVRYARPSPGEFALAFFNQYSLSLLLVFAVLTGLIVVSVLSFVFIQKYRAGRS